MRRVLLWIGAVVVLFGVPVAIWSYRLRIAREAREAGYRAALQRYSNALKPGMSRREVEGYLRENGQSFLQLCCIGSKGDGALDDLVRVGDEPPPWFCSELTVNIAFDFSRKEPRSGLNAQDTDILDEVSILHYPTGCL